MRFEEFELWQRIDSFDELGNSKKDYEFLQNISVCLNEEHLETDGTDNRFFVKSCRGVTAFNDFELGEEYKLMNSQHIFKVVSFINSRWGQLVLEEVSQ